MAAFNEGKWALAICGRCGRQVPYQSLKKDISNQRWTGLWTCDECNDEDQPQFLVGKNFKTEAIALEHPLPDKWDNVSVQQYWGWKPVNQMTTNIQLGRVTVKTS